MAYYVPKQHEKAYYDFVWSQANPNNKLDVPGMECATFFQKSGLDKTILRTIWALTGAGSTINQIQFSTAIRYIALAQQGREPLSKEMLASTGTVITLKIFSV